MIVLVRLSVIAKEKLVVFADIEGHLALLNVTVLPRLAMLVVRGFIGPEFTITLRTRHDLVTAPNPIRVIERCAAI